MAGSKSTLEQLNEIFNIMQDAHYIDKKNVEELNDLRISNAKKLHSLVLNLKQQEYTEEINLQFKVNELYLKNGGNAKMVAAREEHRARLRQIDEEIAAATEAEQEKLKLKKLSILAEWELRKETDEEFRKEQKKLDDKEAKEKKKKAKKDATDAFKTASSALGSSIGDVFNKNHINKAREELEEQGITGEKADKYIKAAQADATYKALAGFAKQLENTATEVATAQSEIDTRLYGSKNDKSILGSYWKKMSDNITTNIGMSPFLKQSDAVASLKNLVGKGIAYNVEQRAFLDTISEKIATTFEAADATLVKLVRIQQADSTAARLGMEAALNEFLNNMYETTEYMSEIASDIRGQIYEASALMSAEEATEFEYQVQKWMGSLYSVGFNNASGLSGALGKLAAGDISGITDGGFGNLLVMAANKANLSIAEILADGLDDTATNKLMQAMVDYLGGIYEETKDNKVVAQQFANVYGLTASDLKAAANLASSVNIVTRENQTTSSLLQNLTKMADSMWSRTATGTMVTNMFENLKYSTASTIGNNPVLYTTYMIASMLDDTVGGIAIPSIGAWAMGNGTEVDLETTVADIMRTGAMAGGLLGGIGKMLWGLGTGGGFSGSGMLKAFGVNTKGITTLTRGDGNSSMITSSGATVSSSGYAGNENSEDMINSTIAGEQDKAKQQAIEAQEEQREVGLANVDEHVVQIHTLLQEVVNGTRKLHVIYEGGADSWTSSYTPSGVPIL